MKILLVIVCSITLAISIAAIILVSNQRRADVNDKLARQHDIALLSRQNCNAINKINQALRAKADDDYRHLDKNARLLHIPVTPALRQAALKGKQKAHKRFADQPC